MTEAPKGTPQTLRERLTALAPFLTSHHPSCGRFEGHTYSAFGREWCVGCAWGYPSAAIVFALGCLLGWFEAAATRPPLGAWGLVLLGLLTTTAAYSLSPLGLVKTRRGKAVKAAGAGAGVGLVAGGAWVMAGPAWLKLLRLIIFVQVAAAGVGAISALGMKRECSRCEYDGDWGNCPGMSAVVAALSPSGKEKEKKRKRGPGCREIA
ncbi:MAG: hypothetical protein Kow0069_21910 [Promethearchaeota archaeon]